MIDIYVKIGILLGLAGALRALWWRKHALRHQARHGWKWQDSDKVTQITRPGHGLRLV